MTKKNKIALDKPILKTPTAQSAEETKRKIRDAFSHRDKVRATLRNGVKQCVVG